MFKIMKKTGLALLAASALALCANGALASEGEHLKLTNWSFNGPFGTYNRAELQRGFQVYKEVCSACHSLKRIAFRDLGALGFNVAEVKALAAGYQVTDGPNKDGEMFQRAAKPSDHIPGPFANEQAARVANGGALPPDLSLLAKSRHNGPDYIHGVLTGFAEPPAGFVMNTGMNYNKAFPGNQIAMPPPLSDDQVTYADGTKASVDQMAHDVSAFLMWAAEPKLEDRHAMGFKVMIFMGLFTVLLYFVKRKVWAGLDKKKSKKA
jgi:ubiquinol-cytochrome c reductase cytochrome c1 subunit